MTRVPLLLATLPLLAIIAGAAPVPAATGPDRPVIPPTRDAVLGYRLQPAQGETINARVSLLAGARTLRMDLPDFTFMLATPATHNLVMVVPLEHTVVDLAWSDGPQSLFLLDDHARFTRKGEATVAGQRCTIYDMQGDVTPGTVCVSADGLVLRHQTTDPQGRRNLVEAFAVQLGGTTEDEFKLPRGYERLEPTLPPLLPPTR